MLTARGVTVALGTHTVLRDVSVSVAPGEVVAVVGPNGAGKSTLLAVLSGWHRPVAGEVRLDGRRLERWGGETLARRRAVLPQTTVLNFPLTALEVVLLGRLPHHATTRRQENVHLAAASMLATGTASLRERRYSTLSGGERQRVQLARVLAQLGYPGGDRDLTGRYLLLDEPTEALDLGFQLGCLAMARDVATRGAGVVLVLHDLNLAAMYAHRVCVLHRGGVAASGRPSQVFQAPTVRQVFGVEAVIRPHPVHDCPQVIPVQAVPVPGSGNAPGVPTTP